jgi:hypothetical protein
MAVLVRISPKEGNGPLYLFGDNYQVIFPVYWFIESSATVEVCKIIVSMGALALSTISLQATIVPIASDLCERIQQPNWARPSSRPIRLMLLPDGSGWVSYAKRAADRSFRHQAAP